MGGVIALGEAAGKARLLAGLEDAAGIAFTTEDTEEARRTRRRNEEVFGACFSP